MPTTSQKMNPEIKQRWIEALQSGEYSKAKGRLKGQDGFCCLGVLCDLHAKETGNQFKSYGYGRYYYLNRIHFLPDEVADWAGLPSDGRDLYFTFKSSVGKDSLVSLNDRSTTFKPVIKAIKNHF